MTAGTGKPTVEGLYAAEIYYGWKLLEWYEGRWWFDKRTAHWGAEDPVQWAGPLPGRLARNFLPNPKDLPMEFDL